MENEHDCERDIRAASGETGSSAGFGRREKRESSHTATCFIGQFGCYFDRSHHVHFDTYAQFCNDTLVSNYTLQETKVPFAKCNEWFYAKEACFEHGEKKVLAISSQWLTFVYKFMGIFPQKARSANFPKASYISMENIFTMSC